jgi:surfactin family lipopeptide synthetase A
MVNQVQPTNPFFEFKKIEIEQSISARFEQQVKQYPTRLAVKTKNHELTYEALNQAANRVAHAILAQCGPRMEPIALLADPSALTVAGILGILKAGKIWVPIDPSFPQPELAKFCSMSKLRLSLLMTKVSL